MLQNDLYLKPYHACKYVHRNRTERDHFKHCWSIYPTNGHLIPRILTPNIINVPLLPWTIHVAIGEASDLTTVSCSHTGWSSMYTFRCIPEYMLRNEQSNCGCQHLHRVSPHMERVWTYYIDLFVCVPIDVEFSTWWSSHVTVHSTEYPKHSFVLSYFLASSCQPITFLT